MRRLADAARVLNQMQIQMCTQMALRAENLQDPHERTCFGKDIVEMDAMVRTALDCLRGIADQESFVLLDVQVVGMAAAPVRAQASSPRCTTPRRNTAIGQWPRRWAGGYFDAAPA
jgi:hypothetical protein